MDQELKQRLIGAAVITALAVIFVPMLFDDPVDESGQRVNELILPNASVQSFEATAGRLPPDETGLPGPSGEKVTADTTASVENSDINQQELIEDPGFQPEPFVEEPIFEVDIPEPEAAKPSPKPEFKAAPKPALKSSSPQAVTKGSVPSVSRSGWLIQLASFSQRDNALSLRDKLRSQGFPATIDEVDTGSGKSYRLVIGPLTDKNKAEAMQAKLNKQNQSQSLLLEVGPKQTDAGKAPSAAKTAPALSNSTLQRWYIQVGSFSQPENATDLRDKLRAQGFPVMIDSVSIANGKSYRLRVGPELDKKRAQAMQEKLNQQNHLNSLLVSE